MAKTVFLILALCAGVCILAPGATYQPVLAQGDHGRDLYCFKKTMEGEAPYRDYWWLYGPLMPYYYALFYRALGVTVRSVLIGRALLLLACGLLVYRICLLWARPFPSLAVSLAFWAYQTDFYHTYAYTGGTVLLLASILEALLYARGRRRAHLWRGLAWLALLALVKFNIGVAAFGAFLASAVLADFLAGGARGLRRSLFLYYGMAVAFTGAVALAYAPFLRGLPADVLSQSFIWSSSVRMFVTPPAESARLLARTVVAQWAGDRRLIAFSALLALSCAAAVRAALRRRPGRATGAEAAGTLIPLLAFSAAGLHEYLLSGSEYQAYWAFPPFFLLLSLAVLLGLRGSGRAAETAAGALIAALALSALRDGRLDVMAHKTPDRFLGFPRGQVYAANSPDWFSTVRGAVGFLAENTRPDERIVALPYDTLYCFLAERDSAIRQQEIFGFGHPTERQEREIIARMEGGRVDWVVLSNRYRSKESPRFGTFGEDYCRTLADYLARNFDAAATFGPWRRDPRDWVNDHAVMILKRRAGEGRASAPRCSVPPVLREDRNV